MSGRRVWTRKDLEALGVRTDLFTACDIVLGVGKDKARELYRSGELPFHAMKVGRRIVVPVAPLMRLLGLDETQAA
ncbi:MAG: DNA-binding protein [Jiangellaceae bacterium]